MKINRLSNRDISTTNKYWIRRQYRMLRINPQPVCVCCVESWPGHILTCLSAVVLFQLPVLLVSELREGTRRRVLTEMLL